jgi:hypoxanthine phosphoribosyltransferase
MDTFNIIAGVFTISGLSIFGIISWFKRHKIICSIHNPELPIESSALSFEDLKRGFGDLTKDAEAFNPDYIYGINRGGALVGGFIAKQLRIPQIYLLTINCDQVVGQRVVEHRKDRKRIRGRILLVDDAKRKGEHMREAYEYLSANYKDIQIRRLVLLELRGLPHHGPEQSTFISPMVERSAYFTFNSATCLPWDRSS